MILKKIFGVLSEMMLILILLFVTTWIMSCVGLIPPIPLFFLILSFLTTAGGILVILWIFLGFFLFIEEAPPFGRLPTEEDLKRKKEAKIYLKMWVLITIFIILLIPCEKSFAVSLATSLLIVLALYFKEIGTFLSKILKKKN